MPSIVLNFLCPLLIFGLNILPFSHFVFAPLLIWTLNSMYFIGFPRYLIVHTCYGLKVYLKVSCVGNLIPSVTVLASGTFER